MPPSAQRRRTRKQPDPAEKSEPEDVEKLATPNRKRRRTNNHQASAATTTSAAATDSATLSRPADPAMRKKTRSSDIKVYEDDSSFTEDDVDNVIRNLREAKYNVAARMDYANEVHEANNPEGKQAYAKIAGNGWTFYVDELEVRIGRPPDERQPKVNGDVPSKDALLDKSLVHIDLGPSKLVSRQHAEIRYDEHSGSWYIAVNGRNGIKLDERPLNRGQSATLQSGCVIEIAGTQMMFVTPNQVPQINPTVLSQIKAAQEDDEDEDDVDLMGPPSLPHRTPTRGAASRSDGQRPAPSQNQQPGNNRQSQRANNEHATAPSSTTQHDPLTDVPSSQPRHRPSPTFSRGLMLETAEDIDYSADNAKDLKPPHSYAQLIGMAILSTPEEKLTLSKIYDWIKERYAFYRFSGGGWQNSIRHNLSLNKSFEKVARRTDEPGKGMKWQIAPEHREEFIKKGLNGTRKAHGRTSSVPNSPSKEPSSMELQAAEHVFPKEARDLPPEPKKTPGPYGLKTSPGSTPPVSHYPQVKQAYTPEQGLDRFASGPFDGSSPTKGFGTGISPFPFSTKARDRWSGMTEAAVAGTPGGPRISFGSEPQEHLMTPLITKQAPKLAPPSTARLPSQFMPMSSPAPFWKYADFEGSPAKLTALGLGMSPIKTEAKPNLNGQKEESGDEKPKESLEASKEEMVRSSSPPLAEGEVGSESPTRAATQRGSESKLVAPPPISLQPGRSHSAGSSRVNGHRGAQTAKATPVPPTRDDEEEAEDDEDEEEGGMIDLARGFQPIGSFHRNMSAGIVGRN